MLAALLATAVLGRVMLDAQPIESTALTRAPMPHFDPRSYGAKGDGVTYDTDAIQNAIDACAGTGGSVVFRPGKYVSAHLTLRGTMTVYLEKGASLLGGTNMNDYPVVLPEKPSTRALCRSLIYACNADGLTIDGEGEIDGRCKDVNMPDDVRKGSTESKRPSLIRIFRSRNITIRNITLRNPCMWTQIYSECDNLLIDGVTVDAPPDCWNLDGMDICDSRDVIVRNCNVRSEDDGICLKSIGARGLQNILLENNRIHCFRANAIKLGSSTRGPVSGVVIRGNKITYAKYAGLVLASVDGSVVKDIRVEDLEMENVGQPIFIRLGNRGALGSIDGISIERLTARATNPDNGPACVIAGIPEARIKNVRIANSRIEMPGGMNRIPGMPPEKERLYPQSNMFTNIPGYAFFVRHADGVVLENVTISKLASDARPWLSIVDAEVKEIGCNDIGLLPSAKVTIDK